MPAERLTLAANYAPGAGALQLSSMDGIPEPPFSLAVCDPQTGAVKLDYKAWKHLGAGVLAGEAESEDVACHMGDVVAVACELRSYSHKFVFRIDSREF
jgi:hypothetical protein